MDLSRLEDNYEKNEVAENDIQLGNFPNNQPKSPNQIDDWLRSFY